MAEYGSFGKGFNISRQARQVAEINKAKAQADAQNAQRDDARAVGEGIRDNLVAARDNAVTVIDGMNTGLIELAKLGQLDPQVVAEVRRNQLLALSNVASVYDEMRAAAAGDPNIDENMLRGMPSGAQFVQNQLARLESETVGAMAQAPIPKNRAEAEGLLAKTAVLLGYDDPSQLSPEIRGAVAGTTIDTKFELFMNPDGTYSTFDTSTEQGRTAARRAAANGSNRVGAQIQAGSAAELTGKDYTKFRSDMTATMDMLSQLDRIRVIMDDEAPIATGLTREVAGFLTEAASQLAQASEVFGFTVESELLGPSGALDLGGLDYSGIEDQGLRELVARSETLKFALGALAFMRARAMDPNDRLSGQEVQVQLNEIGRGKLTTLPSILDEIELETLSRFNNRLLIYQTDPHFSQTNSVPAVLQNRLDRAAAAYNPGTGQQVTPEETQLTGPEDKNAVPKLITYFSGMETPNLSDPKAVEMFSAMSPKQQAEWLAEAQKRGWIK